MMNLTVKVNNQLVSSGGIRIVNDRPVVSWDFNEIQVVDPDPYGVIGDATLIEQRSFEIRIGTSQTNLGADSFVAGIKGTGVVLSALRSWKYIGQPLQRGTTYFGQIIVEDSEGNSTGWETFSFKFNQLPVAMSPTLSPSTPSAADAITLTYSYTDADGDTEDGTLIKWFRNGSHEWQFDNETSIGSSFLSYNDIWMAQVLPSDGYEVGPSVTSNTVTVTTQSPTGTAAKVLPPLPKTNDIFSAKYEFSGDLPDKSLIRWYVNGGHQKSFDDHKFARLDVSAGDKVRYEIQPFDGVSYGSMVVSNTATVLASPFGVENIRVDGRDEPLSLNSLRPAISWDVVDPGGAVANWVSIRICATAGGDQVFSSDFQSQESVFIVPGNTLERGRDYFVSVAVSDSNVFANYSIAHFRVSGSRWTEKVANTTGWTVEAVVCLAAESSSEFNEAEYQIISFEDGVYFGEVRIYRDRLSFASSSVKFSENMDLAKSNILTIVGKGTDVKVYLGRKEVIDATGLFLQKSSRKSLEFGSNLVFDTFSLAYQSFYYSVAGAFHPGTANEFNDLQFHELAAFPFNSASRMKAFVDNRVNKKVFALNADSQSDGSVINVIVPGQVQSFGAVPRTFSPISNAAQSPDGVFKIFSHARGASIFKGYLINNFDHLTDFATNATNPTDDGWELVQNMGTGVITFSGDGLEINTS
jgi:hypothetical protein